MILILLPMSSRIVSAPSTMVPLFAARASSWRSPNIPGTSDSVAPCMPLRRLCSSTQSFLVRDVKTFMYLVTFSWADGYSSHMWGCCADESGMLTSVSSSARVAI
eukprot:7831420-Pyramimonas_sp.AAC.1